MKRFLVVLLTAFALVVGATSAQAGGSDGPTPYHVTTEGIQLPNGDTFQAHGHVNIQYYLPGHNQKQSAGIHFDPNNNHPGGQWIGESFLPWSAFGLSEGLISWVQIHGYNQHFGEGGQKGVPIHPAPEPREEKRHDSEWGDWDGTPNCETWEMDFTRDLVKTWEKRTSTVAWNNEMMDWEETWSEWEEYKSEVVDTETKTERLDPNYEGCGLPPTGAPVIALIGAAALLTGGGVLAIRKSRK